MEEIETSRDLDIPRSLEELRRIVSASQPLNDSRRDDRHALLAAVHIYKNLYPNIFRFTC